MTGAIRPDAGKCRSGHVGGPPVPVVNPPNNGSSVAASLPFTVMPRSSSVLVVTLAVVLVALGAWLLGGSGGQDLNPNTGPGATSEAAVATTLRVDGEDDAAGSTAALGDTERRAVAAGPDTDATVGIKGQVIDASGKPIAAAKVVCRSNAGFEFDPDTFDAGDFDMESMRDRFRNARSETAEATTDAQGRFRVGAPGTGPNVQLRVQARAHLVLDRSVPRPVERDVDLGALTVQTGAVVSGRVLDRGGRAVADARVARRSERSRGSDIEAFQFLGNDFADRFGGGDDARTDNEGRFELAHVAPGNFALVANHEDHPPARLDGLTVEAEATLAGVIVTVEPGTVIGGKLIDIPKGTDRLRVLASTPRANEAQAQGVMAFLGDSGEMIANLGGSDRSADVAKDGTFELRGLAVGQTYRVWAVQRGRGFTGNATCSQRQEVMSGAKDVELRYEAGVTVTFTALDAGTGAPIEQLWVNDRLAGNSNEGFDFMSFMPAMGRMKTYPDGKVTIANLRPKTKQTLTLSVEALGFAKQERKGVELPLVGSVDLGAIRLEPTPVVRVEVRSAADGTPVAGATVEIRERRDASTNNPLEMVMQMRAPGMSSPQSARTDAEGKAALNGKLGAKIAVAVTGKEFAPYESADMVLSERGAEHAVRLLRGGTIEVTVLDADGKPAPETGVDHKAPGGARDNKRTDASGVARFGHVAPGEHEFKLGGRGAIAQANGGFAFELRAGTQGAANEDWSKVTVADQGLATLELGKAAVATLAGFVRENGVPLAGAQVSFVKGTGEGEADAGVNQALEATLGDFAGASFGGRARGNSRGRTDDTGAYELTNLPPGEHRLRITHRERATPTTVRISLGAGSNAFDVGLSTTTLRGIVRDHAGQPVAGASVSVAPATSGDRAVSGAMEMLGNMPELAQFAGRGNRGQVTTDAQGRYELRGVEDGKPVVVRAQAKGFAAATSKPVTPGAGTVTDDVDVQLVAAGSVRVRYATQTPFATVQATCTSVEGVTPVTRMMRRGEATLDGMQAGTWRIALMLPGGEAPAPRTVEVVPGQVVDVSF